MALWEVYTQQCNSQWNTWLGEASMMEKAQFRAEIKIEADKMQELLLAASQYVIALSQICSLASTITDFKLPHKHYRHLCSAWLCPSLYQIATEGGMVDSRQMEDCLKKHSRVDISAQVARAPFCPSPLRYITTTIELCISAAIKIEKIFDKTIGCLQELGETISNCAELSTEVSTVLAFGLKACCHAKQLWKSILESLNASLTAIKTVLSVSSHNHVIQAYKSYTLMILNLSLYQLFQTFFDLQLVTVDEMLANTDVSVLTIKEAAIVNNYNQFHIAVQQTTEKIKADIEFQLSDSIGTPIFS